MGEIAGVKPDGESDFDLIAKQHAEAAARVESLRAGAGVMLGRVASRSEGGVTDATRDELENSAIVQSDIGVSSREATVDAEALFYVDGGLARVRDSYDPNANNADLTDKRAMEDWPL